MWAPDMTRNKVKDYRKSYLLIKRKYILLGRINLWWGELVRRSWAEATAPNGWKKKNNAQ